MSFESDVARLEGIIAALDGSELPLEQALVLFEEGVERLRSAAAALAAAEAKVRVLVERADGRFSVSDLGA